MSTDSGNKSINHADRKITPLQQAAASCVGAVVTSLLVTPLDVIKTRLQSQQKASQTNSKCYLYCNGLMDHLCECDPRLAPLNGGQKTIYFNGTLDAFVKITRHEGLLSLWSGLSPTLVLALPATVLYFVSYEQIRHRMRDYYNKIKNTESSVQPFWIPMSSGALARIVAMTCVSPLELIRTKMQSERMNYTQVSRALKILIETNGVTGLWKGLTSTLLRDVPFSAIYWTNYEGIKRIYGIETPTFAQSFLAGAFSGAIAATITVPFDVVKTHQQIEFGEKAIYTKEPKPDISTVRSAMTMIYKQHGFKGLCAGLVPRLIKVAPACAIMISTFEYGKIFFSNISTDDKPPPIILTGQESLSSSSNSSSSSSSPSISSPSISSYKDIKRIDVKQSDCDLLS